MKKLNLKKHLSSPEVVGKIVSEKSFEFVSKSFPQGEWTILVNNKNEHFLSFSLWRSRGGNQETAFFGVALLPEFSFDPELVDKTITLQLQRALELRKVGGFHFDSCRLFYGDVEGLLGLQVDSYLNAVLIQIGTYGVAIKHELIRGFYSRLFPEKKILIRYKTDFMEVYPIPEHTESLSESESGLSEILYTENELTYRVPYEVIQKNGHYFDQVRNRSKIGHLIQDLKQKNNQRVFKNGLDLFCYTGGWGHLFLSKGLEHVSFVDQGAFGEVVQRTHRENQLGGQAEFHRSDVFTFLDQAIAEKKNFDLISCDPPPFAKSFSAKDNALSGYERLSHKLCKVIAPYGLLVFSSCTKYVSMDELQRVVTEAAKKNQRRSYLVELGTQPLDHPFSTFSEHSFYLKMVAYLVI